MPELINGDVVLIDLCLYWLVSAILFGIMDLYAGKRLGGRQKLAFKVLRVHKYISLVIVSVLTMIGGFLCLKGFEIKTTTATFIGVPYFATWVYYLCSVFARIRAEKHGR